MANVNQAEMGDSSSSRLPSPSPPSSAPHHLRRCHPLINSPVPASYQHDLSRPAARNGARALPASAPAGSYDPLTGDAFEVYDNMYDDDGLNALRALLANDEDRLGFRFADLHVGDGYRRYADPSSRGVYGRAGVVRPTGALENHGSHGGPSMLPNFNSSSDGEGAPNGYIYGYGPYGQDGFAVFPHYDAPCAEYSNGHNKNPLGLSAYSTHLISDVLARSISNIQLQPAGLDVSDSSNSAYRFPDAEMPAPSLWQRDVQSQRSQRSPRGGLKLAHTRDLYYLDLLDFNQILHNLATEQEGCRTLQKMIEEGRPEVVDLIYNGIICSVAKLIKHPVGNYLIQKLLDHCNEYQKLAIIQKLTVYPSQLIEISKDQHGTRAVQKLIETLHTREQLALVVSALDPGVLGLVKDTHGNHVIKACLNTLHYEDAKFYFYVFAKHCVDIATNSNGCCLLQHCIENFSGAYISYLIEQICLNGFHLSMDNYGNYVVQFIVKLQKPRANSILMRQLKGHYVELSKMKCSSNVVEKCIAFFREDGRDTIIRELLSVSPFKQLMQDPFANYVIKTALQCSQGYLRNALVEAIRPHVASLLSSPFCKNILNLIKN